MAEAAAMSIMRVILRVVLVDSWGQNLWRFHGVLKELRPDGDLNLEYRQHGFLQRKKSERCLQRQWEVTIFKDYNSDLWSSRH